MQQAKDFLDESEALHALIAPLSDDQFEQKTGFKNWTINDVIRHLHVWNHGADLSLKGGDECQAFLAEAMKHMEAGSQLRDFENERLGSLRGQDLLKAWRDLYHQLADRFAVVDPSMRVKWAGPDMSARSSITARLMETWAHGQEIYDVLGVERTNTDRIKNIVVLGLNTYGWTFKVRGEDAPQPVPHLRLTAPSGEQWEYNDPSETELIAGSAEEFCQVVTQVRNISDTNLTVTGANANAWMSNAQCFAGPPETPPAPGSRKIATTD